MARVTLAQMETELNEWGCRIFKYFSRISSPNFVAKVSDLPGADCYEHVTNIASGLNRSDVVREAYAEMQAQKAKQLTPETAAVEPAQDSAIEEIPCVLEDKNNRIAELEAQLNAMTVDRDDWKQSCISANRRFEANDAATKEAFALRKQVTKLEGDLEAAKVIIVKAGEDFKALNSKISYVHAKVYSHYAEAKDKATKFSMGGDADRERFYGSIEDELGIILGAFSNVGLPKVTTKPQAPKNAIPATISVDWTGRGYSSAKYPVLGHSQAGKYFVLDISTDPAVTMPKRVSFADCAV